LIDDWLHVKPYQKLIGQIIGAAIVVIRFSSAVDPLAAGEYLITIFWLIGITQCD